MRYGVWYDKFGDLIEDRVSDRPTLWGKIKGWGGVAVFLYMFVVCGCYLLLVMLLAGYNPFPWLEENES